MENENFQQLKSSRWGWPGSAFVSLQLPCSLACAQHPRASGGVAPTPGGGGGCQRQGLFSGETGLEPHCMMTSTAAERVQTPPTPSAEAWPASRAVPYWAGGPPFPWGVFFAPCTPNYSP